jgi:nucleotide-binding universal stress UspA family protein
MKILVPLDGSRTAEAALPIAVRLASDPEMSLVLMAVADVRVNQDPAPAEPEIAPIQEARSYLEAAKGRLLPATEQVFTTVWSGPAAAAIVRAAQTYRVDMIVMTTHGRSGRQRDMFGSVADAVLREASPPVLVLRPAQEVAHEVAPSTRKQETA